MSQEKYNILKSDCESLKNEVVDGAITPKRLGDILCRIVDWIEEIEEEQQENH